MEEREAIEHAFRAQSLRVICATSTLSSGVNLPAHRVIIKAQTTGPVALNGLTYLQMIGRAGRLGQTTKGSALYYSVELSMFQHSYCLADRASASDDDRQTRG